MSPISSENAEADRRKCALRLRVSAIILILISIAIGIFCVKYRGPGSNLISDFGISGIPYTTLWIGCFCVLLPVRKWLAFISLFALFFVIGIELLQLVKTPLLDSLRSTFLGGMILGSNFAWMDFPAFVVGALLGWSLLVCACPNRPSQSDSFP